MLALTRRCHGSPALFVTMELALRGRGGVPITHTGLRQRRRLPRPAQPGAGSGVIPDGCRAEGLRPSLCSSLLKISRGWTGKGVELRGPRMEGDTDACKLSLLFSCGSLLCSGAPGNHA